MFKSEETKTLMRKKVRSPYVCNTQDFTTEPVELSHIDMRRNLEILKEYSVCLTTVESTKARYTLATVLNSTRALTLLPVSAGNS